MYGDFYEFLQAIVVNGNYNCLKGSWLSLENHKFCFSTFFSVHFSVKNSLYFK